MKNGEVQDEGDLGGIVRTQVIRQLCSMNPSAALVVHAEALKLCRMPGLAVALILDFGVDDSGKMSQGCYPIQNGVTFVLQCISPLWSLFLW